MKMETIDEICSRIRVLGSLSIGAEAVCWHLAEGLGIVDALSDLPKKHRSLVMAMAIARAVDFTPRAEGFRFASFSGSGLGRICGIPSKEIPSERFQEALERLPDVQASAERKLQERRRPGDGRVFLYEVTSSCAVDVVCESDYDPWCGCLEERRSSRRISLGMLTDSQGCPLCARSIQRNAGDREAVLKWLEAYRKDCGNPEVFVLGRRGAASGIGRGRNVSRKRGDSGYVCALAKGEASALLDADGSPLESSIPKGDGTSEVVAEEEGLKYVLFFDPEAARKGRRNRPEPPPENRDGNGGSSGAAAVRDGLVVLATDCLQLGADEIRAGYEGLQRVEWIFRSLKTTRAFVPPFSLENEEQELGQVFLCMLVCMLGWKARQVFAGLLETEDGERFPLSGIWTVLRSIHAGRLSLGGKVKENLTHIDEVCQNILDAAGIDKGTLNRLCLKP